ncbi:MAG: NAD-dependent protein deacylase [Bacteroidaceae bacterium]|jgi:NAD-dependent deacetylase|nr:NAD-dependent protein deacylase [Bacteroidaceae bacterium]
MQKIVFLTGAGISAESGLGTFRGSNGLWDKYRIEDVCTVDAWHRNPTYVNDFYTERRKQLPTVQPNEAHKLVASLEQDYEVVVITQNVDDLHERAGSTNIIHLHGELLKLCSSFNKEDESQWQTLDYNNLDLPQGAKAPDGSLLRPYIVWFGENVPRMEEAVIHVEHADIFVIVGTSLNVYPAAGLVSFVPKDTPIYIIDPEADALVSDPRIVQIKEKASTGMKQLTKLLKI